MKKYGLRILVCLLLISSLFHVEVLENNTTSSYKVSLLMIVLILKVKTVKSQVMAMRC